MKFVNSPRGAALVAVFALSGLAACGQHPNEARQATAADPSAVVIGTVPGPATAEPPGTTPVDSGTTEVSKPQERTAMPMPGQSNDHSNLATGPSQRAGTTEAVK
ncbi:MAG TPA: hypothetical protein VF348_04860 [Usitatibacter sp.]